MAHCHHQICCDQISVLLLLAAALEEVASFASLDLRVGVNGYVFLVMLPLARVARLKISAFFTLLEVEYLIPSFLSSLIVDFSRSIGLGSSQATIDILTSFPVLLYLTSPNNEYGVKVQYG